jgi:hypothetical protein
VRGRRALGALVVSLACSEGTAAAQPEPADAHQAAAARLISLTVATATDEDVTQIVAYLRPLLEMRGYLLAVRRADSVSSAQPARPGSQPGVRARVWLDLQTRRQAQLLFAVGDQAPIARVVPTAARIDEVAAAEIAEIILATLLAPEGALAGSRPSGEAAPELAPTAAAVPGTWRRSVGILGAASSWADGVSAVPEVGLSLVLEWRPVAASWSRAVWSTLRYRPPFEAAQGSIRARVRGAEGEVLAVLAHRLGRHASLGLAVGPGVDARFADPAPATGAALTRRHSVRELAVFLRAALRVDLRLGGPLSLFAALTLDLVPLQGRLMVNESGAARPVFTPWPLRPGALVGVAFAF